MLALKVPLASEGTVANVKHTGLAGFVSLHCWIVRVVLGGQLNPIKSTFCPAGFISLSGVTDAEALDPLKRATAAFAAGSAHETCPTTILRFGCTATPESCPPGVEHSDGVATPFCPNVVSSVPFPLNRTIVAV